jgi:prophage antirepressor-like protein
VTEIQFFENGEFELRVIETADSFLVDASGLARALGMRDAYRLVETLPDEEKSKVRGYTTACTPGDQEIWHVTEPGFYRAIGQRQPARIKNDAVRAQVVRFQNWVYREVLPALRKHGSYRMSQVPAVAARVDDEQPDLYTWKEVCFVIRRDYRVRVHVSKLRRFLMAGGVLAQSYEPKAGFAGCFWWTGTAHLVHRAAVPRLFFEYQRTERLLGLSRSGRQAELVASNQGELPFGGES